MRRSLVLAAALGLAACTPSRRTAPVERFVVANGARLQVLDWGGPSGATGLVFIHGLGDSPHAFDDIAPHFTDHFRVVAYGRRAHARSEVKPPYDNATLTEDLAQLMDSLGIRRAVLVGWSLGGTEETGMALRHPERVAGLVLLETYNYSDGSVQDLMKHAPNFAGWAAPDTSSPAAFRAWWKRVSSPSAPLTPSEDAEIADLTTPNANGTVHIVTDDSVSARMFAGAGDWHADFAKIRVPVLGIWGHPYLRGHLPDSAPDSLKRKMAVFVDSVIPPFQDSTVARFHAAMPQARLLVLDSGIHAIFPFQNRDTIVAEMRRFLAGIR